MEHGSPKVGCRMECLFTSGKGYSDPIRGMKCSNKCQTLRLGVRKSRRGRAKVSRCFSTVHPAYLEGVEVQNTEHMFTGKIGATDLTHWHKSGPLLRLVEVQGLSKEVGTNSSAGKKCSISGSQTLRPVTPISSSAMKASSWAHLQERSQGLRA